MEKNIIYISTTEWGIFVDMNEVSLIEVLMCLEEQFALRGVSEK